MLKHLLIDHIHFIHGAFYIVFILFAHYGHSMLNALNSQTGDENSQWVKLPPSASCFGEEGESLFSALDLTARLRMKIC